MANDLEIIEKLAWASSTSILQKKINEILDYLNPNKYFNFLATQAGGAEPTATTVRNTTGLGTPAFARSSAGIYTFTLVGAFTANKTIGIVSNNIDGLNAYTIERTSADVMTIKTYVLSVDEGVLIETLTDGLLTATPISIEIQG